MTSATSAQMLTTLVLCALMGLLGQGTRAAIGLKAAAALEDGMPGTQSAFNAAYFAISMMIGSIAGILAGLGLGLDKLMSFNPVDIKPLLGIAVAGYAGVDFIENAFSRIIPGLGGVQPPASPATSPQAPAGGAAPATSKAMPMPGVMAPAAPPLQAALAMVAPSVNAGLWMPALQAAFDQFGFNTNRRMAAAIGQFMVEASAGLHPLIEDLTYTTADRIVAVFKDEFATAADAQPYVRNPAGLANRAYANRLGNGDEASGDGYRFCGRGLIQLTGRATYTAFANSIGMTPEQASTYCTTPPGAAMSGCWYLATHGCLPLADAWALSDITERVCGSAMLGNAQRIAYANEMLKALGG